MFAIEVNFLTGRYVATAHDDREGHEWPPHPARLFSALIATWAEAAEEAEAAEGECVAVSRRAALEWLESQAAPALAASEAAPRKVVKHYVPVNDTRIIGGSWYDRKALNIADLEDQLQAELDRDGSGMTRKAATLRTRIGKHLNVSDQVSKLGTTAPSSAAELLPEGRKKQERNFPSVTPVEPRVTYVWPNAEPQDATRSALDRILAGVTRLGHSSSLVSCRLVDDPPEPNYIPGSGPLVMRCVRASQLAALERRHQFHQSSKPRSLPFAAVRYRNTDEGAANRGASDGPAARPNTAGDWYVFKFSVGSRRMPSSRTVDVASKMREAFMRYAEDPIPEGLSGHRRDGSPSRHPHAAFVPLPYVGFKHADGRIMGIAVSLPASLDETSRRAALRGIGIWEREAEKRAAEEPELMLTFGRGGTLRLKRCSGPIDLITIRPGVWSKPSHRWVSATPVALPRHPGRLERGTVAARAKAWKRAEQMVAASCVHVGLPEPARVEVSLSPYVTGARPAPDFPAFRQRGRDGRPVSRRLVHAAVVFDQPVGGPLMLGAGRFLGLGLMRPVRESQKPVKPVDERDSDDA